MGTCLFQRGGWCSKVNRNVTKRDKAILDKNDYIIMNRKYDLCMILCCYSKRANILVRTVWNVKI